LVAFFLAAGLLSTPAVAASASAEPTEPNRSASGIAGAQTAEGATVSYTGGGAQPLVPARLMDTRAGAVTVDSVP
jgi:hypothetical protein